MESSTLLIAVAVFALAAAVLAFGIIVALALRTTVREFTGQQQWLWSRMIALFEPSVQHRVHEFQEAEEEAARLAEMEDQESVLVPPEPPKPFNFG